MDELITNTSCPRAPLLSLLRPASSPDNVAFGSHPDSKTGSCVRPRYKLGAKMANAYTRVGASFLFAGVSVLGVISFQPIVERARKAGEMR